MGQLFDRFEAALNKERNKPGFNIAKFGEEFLARGKVPAQPKAPTRGIIGDIAASAARSAIGVPQMALEAFRALDAPGGRDPLRAILTPAI